MDHEASLSIRISFTVLAAAVMLVMTAGTAAYFQGNEEHGMNALLAKQKKEAYDYLEEMDGMAVSGSVANSLIREFKGQDFSFWLEGSYHYFNLTPTPNGRYKADTATPLVNCRFSDQYDPESATCNDADFSAVYDCAILYGTNDQPIGIRFNRR